MRATSYNHVHVYQALDALMDGSTAHSAFGSDILERDACIVGDNLQNLLVKRINSFHCLGVCFVTK